MNSSSEMLLNHILCFTLELCTSNQDQRDFLFFIAVGYYKLGVSNISFGRIKFVFQERLRKKTDVNISQISQEICFVLTKQFSV